MLFPIRTGFKSSELTRIEKQYEYNKDDRNKKPVLKEFRFMLLPLFSEQKWKSAQKEKNYCRHYDKNNCTDYLRYDDMLYSYTDKRIIYVPVKLSIQIFSFQFLFTVPRKICVSSIFTKWISSNGSPFFTLTLMLFMQSQATKLYLHVT